MKKISLVIFIVFINLYGYGQKKFSIEVLTGIGINKEIILTNESIEDYFALSSQVKLNYKFKLIKNIFAETGIGIQSHFSKGSVGISNFSSESLRLNLPFVIGYSILEKIDIGAGLSIANNRDFDNIDFRGNNNLRQSLILKISYNLKEKINFLLIAKHNISNIPEVYFINQPRTDISIGVSYKLF